VGTSSYEFPLPTTIFTNNTLYDLVVIIDSDNSQSKNTDDWEGIYYGADADSSAMAQEVTIYQVP
jgi:RNA polymerase subunit RPABC4/transcription elongation factor Spt4